MGVTGWKGGRGTGRPPGTASMGQGAGVVMVGAGVHVLFQSPGSSGGLVGAGGNAGVVMVGAGGNVLFHSPRSIGGVVGAGGND